MTSDTVAKALSSLKAIRKLDDALTATHAGPTYDLKEMGFAEDALIEAVYGAVDGVASYRELADAVEALATERGVLMDELADAEVQASRDMRTIEDERDRLQDERDRLRKMLKGAIGVLEAEGNGRWFKTKAAAYLEHMQANLLEQAERMKAALLLPKEAHDDARH